MQNNIIYINFIKNKEVVVMCEILKKIKNKSAYDLLFEYDIKLEPPIDIGELLSKIGIFTVEVDFTDIEKSENVEYGSILGAAFSDDEDLYILYRRGDTYNRQLFSIAHELGHCCLHSDDLKINHIEFRNINQTDNIREYSANVFAGELLIPENVLMPIYNKFIIPSLEALSKIFGVSTTVMAARLDYLNLDYYKDTKLSED